MRKILFFCVFFLCCSISAPKIFAQCQGNVYIASLSFQTPNSVHGFTSTELDYCAGLYYDPADWGNFSEQLQSGSSVVGDGYTEGYGSTIPASVGFDFFAPVQGAAYTTNGSHYVIAYYLVYVPSWNNYYWYDPFNFGFGETGGGYEQGLDDSGYWNYVSYWESSPQHIGTTAHAITYVGQTQCLPGQQYTQTGEPCSRVSGCESGQQFSSTGETCPNYVPPPESPVEPNVTVHVSGQPLSPINTRGFGNGPSKNVLTKTCINGVSEPAGRQVILQLENDSHAMIEAGHITAYHTGPKPAGRLGRTAGITDGNGCFTTTYLPSHLSGNYRINSTISGITNHTSFWVIVEGLQNIPKGENYRLVGGGPDDCDAPSCDSNAVNSKYAKAHPSDHWVVPESIPGLVNIANEYKAQFYPNGIRPDQMVAYNDASLMFGGKFDLPRGSNTKSDWRDGPAGRFPHGEHRLGHNVDVRMDPNIPNQLEEDLIKICVRNNFGINDERAGAAPHIHLDWYNPTRRSGRGRTSLLQNGIDQNAAEYYSVSLTPSTLVTNAGESILDREITQTEFESWFQQMSSAKIQGLNVFLQEVKTFEKQLFSSPEYAARQRTDEQFVLDVFASHLFRDPTGEELAYWIGILSEIGGSQQIDPEDTELPQTRTAAIVSQEQRRQIFLDNFENIPAFVDLIGNAANDAYQEPPH